MFGKIVAELPDDSYGRSNHGARGVPSQQNGTRLVSLSLPDGTVNSFHVKCNQNLSCNKCLLLFRGNFSKCDRRPNLGKITWRVGCLDINNIDF